MQKYSGRVEIVGLYRTLGDGAKYSIIRIGDQEIRDLKANDRLNRCLNAAMFRGAHVEAYVFKRTARGRVLVGLRDDDGLVTVDKRPVGGTVTLIVFGIVLLPLLIGAVLLYNALGRAHLNQTLKMIAQKPAE